MNYELNQEMIVSTTSSTPLIKIINLTKYYKTPFGNLHAVDGVNAEICSGRTLGVVGESGCGKSTLGRAILRLTKPTSGEVWFKGELIQSFNKRKLLKARQKLQIIFQDPFSSLNPRLTVSELIAEPLIVNKLYSNRREMMKRVYSLMETVELSARFAHVYPHELDGGRRQRIGIARALAPNPDFIVCDEPVSALDVSVQAQILNLMMDLQDELGLAYMFITHNLSVVRHISQVVAVMYLGKIVEMADADELFTNPKHPYTIALLDAIPVPNLSGRDKERLILEGEVKSPINPPPGCRFAPRCPYATDECTQNEIEQKEISPRHYVKCVMHN